MIRSATLDSSPLVAFSFRSTVEWRSPRHNVLLEGPEPSTLAVLRLLEPYLPAPVMRRTRGAPFQVLPDDVGGLILEDVGGLGPEEQARLLAWIDRRPLVQIVSTSADRLFAFVTRGGFDASLYYRLNIILIEVDRRQDFGFHAGVAGADTQSRAEASVRQLS
jgi:hypothetical protein